MRKIKNYPQKTYQHAVVAVDVVLFSVVKEKFQVLLIQLNEEPFVNSWALPGGLVAPKENLDKAAARHLKQKANIENALIEQLYTFGDPKRDPKGWVVSVAYMALIPNVGLNPKTQSRYKKIQWHPVRALPAMAYDHERIIKSAFKRLASKLEYTNIVYSLISKEFTLTELQNIYEIILGEKLDKRNFRKKINSLGILQKLPGKKKSGAFRPAQVYRFLERSPQLVEIL